MSSWYSDHKGIPYDLDDEDHEEIRTQEMAKLIAMGYTQEQAARIVKD